MIKKLLNKINPFCGSKGQAISFRAGFDLTQLPVITVYQEGKRFNFLLDTGSNFSIIDRNILSKVKHIVTEEMPDADVYGIDGSGKEATFCFITFSFGGKDFTYPYVMLDMKEALSKLKKETGVTIHGFIGSLFFNKFKYVLDFDKLIAYPKK